MPGHFRHRAMPVGVQVEEQRLGFSAGSVVFSCQLQKRCFLDPEDCATLGEGRG